MILRIVRDAFNSLVIQSGVLRCQQCGYRNVAEAGIPQQTDTVICGLDLGKTQDPSALTGWRRRVDPITHEAHYAANTIHRWPLGTSYHKSIIPETIRFLQSPRLCHAYLVIDYGNVGAALLELFDVPGLVGRVDAIQTTSGRGWKRDDESGKWNVSKIELCSLVQKLLSSGRIKIRKTDDPDARQYPKLSDSSLIHAVQLESELMNFREKANVRTGNTKMEAKGSTHDDLAMSAAIALFLGERGGFGQIDDRPNEEARGMVSRLPQGVFNEGISGLEDTQGYRSTYDHGLHS